MEENRCQIPLRLKRVAVMFSNNLYRTYTVKNECHKVIGMMSAICVLLGSRYGTNQILLLFLNFLVNSVLKRDDQNCFLSIPVQ